VVRNGSVTFLLRPVVACSIMIGMVIGLNWCFSEIASALKQVVEPSATVGQYMPTETQKAAFNFMAARQDQAGPLGRAPEGKPAKNAPLQVAAGRVDPFAPLADDPEALGALKAESGRDALAMVQVNDPLLGQTTVIRRAGQTVEVGGTQFKISAISPSSLRISYRGQMRTLGLRPLLDSAEGNASQSSATSSGTPVYSSPAPAGQR
jgi:hypothetical protein